MEKDPHPEHLDKYRRKKKDEMRFNNLNDKLQEEKKY